jgi:hypothetical protein
MTNIHKNGHGLIFEEPRLEDYFLGGSSRVPEPKLLRQSRDWLPNVPAFEFQKKRNVESFSCATYAPLNAIETFCSFTYGDEVNYAERFTAIVSETTRKGNTMQAPLEAIRKFGLIVEASLPFDETVTNWNEYMYPKPMEIRHIAEGARWLHTYKLWHEWVAHPTERAEVKSEKIWEALLRSPILASVYAWVEEGGMYVKKNTDNHESLIVGGKEGEYFIFADTYEPFIKRVPWGTDFTFLKRIYVEKDAFTLKEACTIPWYKRIADIMRCRMPRHRHGRRLWNTSFGREEIYNRTRAFPR